MRGGAPEVVIKKAENGHDYEITGEDLAKILPTYTDEQKKYQKCWSVGDYRKYSPGEHLVRLFLDTAETKDGSTLVDWGCGTGRAGKRLYDAGLDVTLVDFAFNALDDEVKEAAEDNDALRFIEHDLTQKIDLPSRFGFCTDVLEHLPEDEVDAALDTILDNSRSVFFQIATTEDHFGEHPDIQDHLHLTVHDYWWWAEKFLEKRCVILHSAETANAVIFYVTGWSNRPLKWEGGLVNTDNETIIANMAENAKLGLSQVVPHESQEQTVMLLAGGPSLNDFEDEIIKQRGEGMPLITTNGTYNWAIERGMSPSLQLVIDAREFNKRFLRPVVDDCKYVLASQCHPESFKGLPKDRTMMWQVSLSDELLPHIKEHYGKMYEDWYPCPGGSTATLRALCLLRMLGFHKIIVYGLDSCYLDDKPHHAYPQTENDEDKTIDITIGGGTSKEKTFRMAPWMAYQLKDFEQMCPRVLSDCQLQIKGPGAIAYLIESNADIDGIE